MDFAKIMSGLGSLLGPKAGPNARSLAKEPAGTQNPEAPASPTAPLINQEHNPTAVALAAKSQDTVSQIDQKSEQQPSEKQGLLMKTIEGIANTFGIKMADLTRLLLKANPLVAQEAVASALQAVLPQQAVTSDSFGESIKAAVAGKAGPEASVLKKESNPTANTEQPTTLAT